MTAGQYGIYSLDLQTRYAVTANTPAAFQVNAAWVDLAISGGSWSVPADGGYYFVDLLAGGTMPFVLVGPTGNGNRALLPSGKYTAINPTESGLSSLPTTLTLGGSSFVRIIVAR
jgi:hypothetical protein